MSTNTLDYETLLARSENDELDELASVFHQLARLSVNINHAISFYERSIEINLHYRPTDVDLLSASYDNLAALLSKRGDHREALKYHRRALNLALRDPHVYPMQIVHRHNQIGQALQHRGKQAEALAHFTTALNIQSEAIPADDPASIATYYNLASAYRLIEDYPLAIDYYKKALRILREDPRRHHSQLVYAYNKLGAVHCLTKNYAAALSCQEEALRIQEQVLSSEHPSLASRHFNMAVALEALRRYPESADHVVQAIDIFRRTPDVHQRKLRRCQKYLNLLRKKF